MTSFSCSSYLYVAHPVVVLSYYDVAVVARPAVVDVGHPLVVLAILM